MAILQDVSVSTLQAQIDKLRAENERLRSQRSPSVSFKVTPKGGVSMYGLGRFPVTLYHSQWVKLIKAVGNLEAFLEDNIDSLTTKEGD